MRRDLIDDVAALIDPVAAWIVVDGRSIDHLAALIDPARALIEMDGRSIDHPAEPIDHRGSRSASASVVFRSRP